MDQLKDNIYDAYYSEKGEEFGKKVRERIHWVTQNVKGNEVLDIGCSQGITSILLGREGKRVLGIDSSTSAIEDANKNLLVEEEETQECVRFEKNNFFLKQFGKEYDDVILGEVLEHITDIETFFDKAVSLTKEGGRVIATTPFGINNFIDHKRTFYLLDFLKLQSNSIAIEEVKFFGKWIGIIYKKENKTSQELQLNDALLQKFEEAIYSIENNYLDQNKNLKKRLNTLKHKLQDLKNEDITKLDDGLNQQEYLKEKAEKVKVQKELYDSYNENEALIKKYKKLLQDYEMLLSRYHSLKNSKLGRLTTKYWQLRRKKRRN